MPLLQRKRESQRERSITRTSNATVARALGAPVLLVGKKGVGDAVDTYCAK